MAYSGAGGGTRTAMARTLDVSAFSDGDVNAGNRELLETLRKADPAVQLEIAKALWLRAGFGIKPDFIKLSHDFYQAEAETLNLQGDPGGAAKTVNAWTDRNTHGKIPSIVDRLDRSTVLVFTDAVYFKGKWTAPFDNKKTNPRRFFFQGGGSVMTPMMTQTGAYWYFETDAFQAIQLPYGNGRFVMYVLSLRHRTGSSYAGELSTFLRSLDEEHWTQWMSKFVYFREGKIILPKFELK